MVAFRALREGFGVFGDQVDRPASDVIPGRSVVVGVQARQVDQAQRLGLPGQILEMDLAGQALQTSNSTLVSAACQGLQSDGSPEAVRLLANALEKSGDSSTWSYVSNALATLGTPEAAIALRKARDSGNEDKSNYANSKAEVQSGNGTFNGDGNSQNLQYPASNSHPTNRETTIAPGNMQTRMKGYRC